MPLPPRRFCIAPMLDWTDRYCRFFLRQLSQNAWLYTEMVTTGALIHGDRARFLRFDDCEHPVALQLGGSDPTDLATCARLGAAAGFDEINLNIGCPSERVQNGSFGACLMAEPALVADGVKAMQDAVSVPVTVKHRVGINEVEDYAYLRDFVGTLYHVGCRVFIVHARNAILKGLSPKENREVPPLKYDYVYQLKRDFPDAEIVLNGGVKTLADCASHLAQVDGVMMGREAYHNPYSLVEVDRLLFGGEAAIPTRAEVMARLSPLLAQMQADGLPIKFLARHILGLYQGQPGARRFRRMLSDSKLLSDNNPALLQQALALVER